MAIERNASVDRRPIVLSDTESDTENYAPSAKGPSSRKTALGVSGRPNLDMEYQDAHPPAPRPKSRPTDVFEVADSPFGSKTTSGKGGSLFATSSYGSIKSSSSQASSNSHDRSSTSFSSAHLGPFDRQFGSSLIGLKRPSKPQKYPSYMKPATPNAFVMTGKNKHTGSSSQGQQTNHDVELLPKGYSAAFRPTVPGVSQHAPPHRAYQSQHHQQQWPAWVTQGQPFPGTQSHKYQHFPVPVVKNKDREAPPEDDGVEREVFDMDDVRLTAADYERHDGDAEAHMRELLSGAIGEGEADDGGHEDGADIIEGFAKNVRLMPHQIRGVKWMKGRESGRKYGGILADDMGLGKTVQTLARIVEGVPTAAELKAGYKAGTLIVAPLAVMEQWATEARTKTVPGRLKVTTHHGPSRTKSPKTLQNFDVVITTFQTLASEHKAFADSKDGANGDSDSDSDTFGKKTLKKKGKAKAPAFGLFGVKWLRVVIDEAQNIKNKNTNAAKAAVALQAKYRWCLTGTPIQNSVDELYSLFKFLRAKPMDNWEVFKERIALPVKRGETKIAMKRLHVLLNAVMLRRTKDAQIDGRPILNLPGRKVEVVACEFDAQEREFYTALEKRTALRFNKFVRSGTVMSNYADVLTMLLRLRQACDHPSLVANALSVDADAIENQKPQITEGNEADDLADLLGGLGMEKSKKCEICFTSLLPSDDIRCKECVEIAEKAAAKGASSEHMPDTSAKIRTLLKILAEVEERGEAKQKTIVFSQFTSFLNIVEPFLKQACIKFVRYDGSMRNDKRQESLEKIKNDPSVRVILISFKAGSTGLNLTCCNNVVLMDLWWNPALEDQAFDRAHRLGQKLDVNIWKLTIGDTVEDRILKLQEMKRELAKAALSGDAKGLMKLSLNDIMALFKPGAAGPRNDDAADV